MFNSLVYWIGARGCSAIGVVGSMISSEPACSNQQTWDIGLILLGSAALLFAYLVFRRRS